MKTIESTYNSALDPAGAGAYSPASIYGRIAASRPGLDGLILRSGLALVLFPHGAQKLLGWFGGYGFSGSMGFLNQTMGIPWLIALLVILIEFFAPLMLLAGLATRFAAVSLAGVMLGAMFMVQLQHGFFMNWSGTQAGEGIQFTLLFVAAAAALAWRGAGSLAIDNRIAATAGKVTDKA